MVAMQWAGFHPQSAVRTTVGNGSAQEYCDVLPSQNGAEAAGRVRIQQLGGTAGGFVGLPMLQGSDR